MLELKKDIQTAEIAVKALQTIMKHTQNINYVPLKERALKLMNVAVKTLNNEITLAKKIDPVKDLEAIVTMIKNNEDQLFVAGDLYCEFDYSERTIRKVIDTMVNNNIIVELTLDQKREISEARKRVRKPKFEGSLKVLNTRTIENFECKKTKIYQLKPGYRRYLEELLEYKQVGLFDDL